MRLADDDYGLGMAIGNVETTLLELVRAYRALAASGTPEVYIVSDMLSGKINDDHDAIVELQELFDKFMDSGFDDYYLEQIEKWVNDNLAELYHLLVKQVYFGLTLEGYFVAYIPESWDDIIFDTGMVYGVDTYGRLILRWDVDNSGESVNQRPEGW